MVRRMGGSVEGWPRRFAGGIAHRLDVWTSGALAVAENLEELEEIRSYFADKRLLKTYRFLASKNPVWNDNVCTAAVAHHKQKKHLMIVQRGQATPHRGKWYPAETRFRRIHGDLWEATMKTGVMHQIRVHAGFVGLALRGDHRYGGGRTPEGRYYLHHVGFTGPIATEPVPLPEWAE